jgi:hypothetical protein
MILKEKCVEVFDYKLLAQRLFYSSDNTLWMQNINDCYCPAGSSRVMV